MHDVFLSQDRPYACVDELATEYIDEPFGVAFWPIYGVLCPE